MYTYTSRMSIHFYIEFIMKLLIIEDSSPLRRSLVVGFNNLGSQPMRQVMVLMDSA